MQGEAVVMQVFRNTDELRAVLMRVFSADTVREARKSEWSRENPAFGQCVPAALVTQSYFGGDIYFLESDGHHYNVIGGQIVDLADAQFLGNLPDYKKGKKRTAPFEPEALERAKILKERVEAAIERQALQRQTVSSEAQDPFYGEKNQERLARSIADAEAGKVTAHEIGE
jgi:hypothetical protein